MGGAEDAVQAVQLQFYVGALRMRGKSRLRGVLAVLAHRVLVTWYTKEGGMNDWDLQMKRIQEEYLKLKQSQWGAGQALHRQKQWGGAGQGHPGGVPEPHGAGTLQGAGRH